MPTMLEDNSFNSKTLDSWVTSPKLSVQVLNLPELVQAAKSIAGVRDVRVLRLEELPLREQLIKVACGNTIVAGVQGAGLGQGGRFLLPHRPPRGPRPRREVPPRSSRAGAARGEDCAWWVY